jgi:hypothetical protein
MMLEARYDILARWANAYGWTRGAELGVSDGRTHLHLLEHCPRLHMVGVDIWDMPGVEPGPTVSNERCRCPTCAMTKAGRKVTTVQERERMARAGVARFGRSVLYKMRTTDAARKVDDASLDFVFVDGDHSQEGVSEDIASWRGKIKLGGRMSGHDWVMKSVRDGVLEHYSIDDIHLEDDHVWWVQQ